MEKQKTIYDLELHEILKINIDTAVMKVHGGWIYTLCLADPSSNKFLAVHNTFVPYEEPINITVGELPSFDDIMLIAKNQSNDK